MSSALSSPNDPNIDLRADQRGRIIGTMVSLYVITSVSVALRFLSRKLSKAGLWWDDYLCLAALIVALMCPSLELYELRHGFGRHIYVYSSRDTQIENSSAWLKSDYFFELMFHTSTTIAKFAVLAFYHRIFRIRPFRRLLYWVAGICVLYVVAVDLTVIFQCQPIHYTWDWIRPGATGHCINEVDFYIGSGAANVGLNLLIFILPMPLLWRLRTTAKQQVILTAIFTLAGFVVLVSIIWVIEVSKAEPDENDPTWRWIDVMIWSGLEPNLAIVCACIPSLRPLASIASRSFSAVSGLRGTLSSASGKSSLKSKWTSAGRQTSSSFNQLEDLDDLRPIGHDVSIHGGKHISGQVEQGTMGLPQEGIMVQREVTLTTSDRLDYDDRLF